LKKEIKMKVYNLNERRTIKERKKDEKPMDMAKYLDAKNRLENIQKSLQKVNKLLSELEQKKEKK